MSVAASPRAQAACPVCRGTGPRAAGVPPLLLCPDCGLVFRAEAGRDRSPCAWSSVPSERAKQAMYGTALRRLAGSTDGRAILDVGCGHGTFLELAAQAGWSAFGVEPDERAAAEARRRGADVFAGTLEDFEGVERFDAVTFWGVLEALPDPVEALERAKRLLKPGGVVLVRTLNAPAHLAAARLTGALGRVMRGPATFHRYGFSDRSLPEAFRRAGLEPDWLDNSPISEGDPYGTAIGIGAAGVSAIKRIVAAGAWAVRAATLGRRHWGTALWAAARKPRTRPAVLHLITRLDPGGSAESTWALVRDWDDPSASLELAYGGQRPELAGDPKAARLAWLGREPSWRDLPALWELVRLIRRRRPDAVHTHSSKAGLLGRIAARLAGVRRVAHTPHGHVFYGYFGPGKSTLYLAIERGCAPWTDAYLALTEGEKRESVEFGLGSSRDWFVAPSGTPLPDPSSLPSRADARRRLGLEPGAFWIGSLLRLERVKGPDVLIDAAARLEPSWRVALLGDGPLRPELERRIRYWGLQGRVALFGRQTAIWTWLAAFDLYVQPSRNEAMGRTLVQAQAAALPVVASRVCGIPDVVREGETGVLVPSESPGELAAAIRSLAADPARRAALGAAGRAWVYSKDENGNRKFSPEAMRDGHRRLYEALFRP